MKKDRWYQHVPAATAVIPCDGEEHHITWRWGKVKLDDHDLGSERAMLVLGGEQCPCLRALGMWATMFGLRPEQFDMMRRAMGAEAALVPKEFDVPREVGMALSMERAWKHSRYFEKQGQLLERQLKEQALPALRAHLNAERQRFGSRVLRGVQVRHVAAGQAHRMEGRMDSVSVSATATLSSLWIVRVWSRGLATVDGGFVLDVIGPGQAPGSVAVRAARWRTTGREPGVAEPVVEAAEAVHGEDGWRLTEAGTEAAPEAETAPNQ